MVDVVALRVGLQQERARDLEQRLLRLLAPLGADERVLDAGCGTGALSLALAPHVGEVVGVDADERFLTAARESAPASCTFVAGDVMALPFAYGEFDLAGSLRVLHHVRRPELAVSELARVTHRSGRILLVDQLGDVDPLVSLEQDRFERARDPSHSRLLSDSDIRSLLDANDLVVVHNETTTERRDVERFLDLAGLEGPERERIRRMAPAPVYDVELGWYVARKP
ncbi:MAG TPA: methyltransferase domain-containing protein [Gaiella sp.]|jgi:ubiquinone/menaquinone biosynthesis C-methylase UbiE